MVNTKAIKVAESDYEWLQEHEDELVGAENVPMRVIVSNLIREYEDN